MANAPAQTARLLARRPRSLLVLDESARTYERRRADCDRLATCEDLWIEERLVISGTVGEQAKCPTKCVRYRVSP